MSKRTSFLVSTVLSFFFTIPGVAQSVRYWYDTGSVGTSNNLSEQVFVPLKESVFSEGSKNGVYWFHVDLSNSDEECYAVLSGLKQVHFEMYKKDGQGELQLVEGGSQSWYDRFYLSKVNNFGSEIQDVYYRIDFSNYAFVSFGFFDSVSYYDRIMMSGLNFGLYYGIVICVFLINLILFFYYKEQVFFYYGCVLSLITTCFLQYDGFLNIALGKGFLVEHTTLFCLYLLTILGGFKFAVIFLHIRKHFPKSRVLELCILSLSTIFVFLYLVTNYLLFYQLSFVSIFLHLGYYYGVSFLLIKVHRYSLFFFIAYTSLIFLAILFLFPRIFGFDSVRLSVNIARVGEAIEMIVLMLAVIDRSRTMEEEIERMKNEIHQYVLLNKHSEGEQIAIDLDQVANSYHLTCREVEILNIMIQGKTNLEISERLFISRNTVKYHIGNIYRKMDVSSRNQVTKIIVQQ